MSTKLNLLAAAAVLSLSFGITAAKADEVGGESLGWGWYYGHYDKSKTKVHVGTETNGNVWSGKKGKATGVSDSNVAGEADAATDDVSASLTTDATSAVGFSSEHGYGDYAGGETDASSWGKAKASNYNNNTGYDSNKASTHGDSNTNSWGSSSGNGSGMTGATSNTTGSASATPGNTSASSGAGSGSTTGVSSIGGGSASGGSNGNANSNSSASSRGSSGSAS
ncbi:hypothetical protein WDZ92_33030 [Nostoc sp. NIES-2111]